MFPQFLVIFILLIDNCMKKNLLVIFFLCIVNNFLQSQTVKVLGYTAAGQQTEYNLNTLTMENSVDYAAAASNTTTSTNNYTVGSRFSVIATQSLLGARIYWLGANQTVTISLWNNAGTLLKQQSYTATAGINVFTFTSAQSLTAGEAYTLGLYNTTGGSNKYTYFTSAGLTTTLPTPPFYAGGGVRILGWNRFEAGNVRPTSSAGAEVYPVMPYFGF